MVDYAGLKAEIALPKYNGMTDEQIAAALEGPVSTTVDVPINLVVGYFMSHLLLGPLQRFLTSPPEGTPQALIDGLSDFLAMLNSPHVTAVAMTDPTTQSLVTQTLTAGVAANLMKQADMDALMAMAIQTTTRAAQLGLLDDVHVIENEMLAARIWPGVSE